MSNPDRSSRPLRKTSVRNENKLRSMLGSSSSDEDRNCSGGRGVNSPGDEPVAGPSGVQRVQTSQDSDKGKGLMVNINFLQHIPGHTHTTFGCHNFCRVSTAPDLWGYLQSKQRVSGS